MFPDVPQVFRRVSHVEREDAPCRTLISLSRGQSGQKAPLAERTELRGISTRVVYIHMFF